MGTIASTWQEPAVRKPRKKIKISSIVIYVILSLWAVTTLFPFVWVIMNSFKNNPAIALNSYSLPIGDAFTLDNYVTAFNRVRILNAYKNSLIITCSVTLLVIIIAGLCAYGFARYSFKGKTVLNSVVIASMMFPAFATIISVYRMEMDWGLVYSGNAFLTQLSVILPQIAGNLSFAIIVLIGFIKGLPVDLEESAYLEGCNIFQILFKIVVPIAKPAFATVAIFTFLWSYNDLFVQLFFLNYPDDYTVTRLLLENRSQAGLNYGMTFATVVLVIVPVLIVYIFLQKNIIKGLTVGAVKG